MMNKKTPGGSAAESAVRERLARRFAQELDRAEQDYPSLPARQWETAERLKGPGRVWRRLVVEAVAILILVGVLAVAFGRPSNDSVAPSATSVVLGSDGIPTQIDGQRVYRATDRASFGSLNGSFLLGGRVTHDPEVIPPCPAPGGPPGDGQGLLPYCSWPSIDGLALSPRSNFGEPKNEIAVARVHVNDPLAAQCNDFARAECQAAVVVESVVWKSNPYGTAPLASEAPTPTAGFSAAEP